MGWRENSPPHLCERNNVMINPCEGCLVEIICCRMCDLAKPFYDGLTTKDKNFNWQEYEEHRNRVHERMISNAKKDYKEGKKSVKDLRRSLGIRDDEKGSFTYGGIDLSIENDT